MERIAQVEQRIGSRETLRQLFARHPDAMHLAELMVVARPGLMEKAVRFAQPVRLQAALEDSNARSILAGIGRRRQNLKPDGLQAKAPQPEHPLERHRKIAAAFGIFCRKPAAEENRHRQRIVRLATGSSRANVHLCACGAMEYRAVNQRPVDASAILRKLALS